ncbi:FeoB-associated Cys-rich membrane protein [Arcanobacterium hippocoleae]
MATVIAVAGLILLVGWAVYYLYQHRKSGKACVGCALETQCPITSLGCANNPENKCGSRVFLQLQVRRPSESDFSAQDFGNAEKIGGNIGNGGGNGNNAKKLQSRKILGKHRGAAAVEIWRRLTLSVKSRLRSKISEAEAE